MEGFPERQHQQRGRGVPGVSLTGQLPRFPSHGALAAKINTSFEIKSQPQEVFILEKEPVRQSVCWRRRHVCPHPAQQALCVKQSAGAKNVGMIETAEGTGRSEWKRFLWGQVGSSLDHRETSSVLSTTMMSITDEVLGTECGTNRQRLSQCLSTCGEGRVSSLTV